MKMWYTTGGKDVEVVNFETSNCNGLPNALCYIPDSSDPGNCWKKVKISKLIPYPYAEAYKNNMSMTQRNKIKSMLTLSYAEWTCTDGTTYDHAHIDDAIQHQAELINNTKEEQN